MRAEHSTPQLAEVVAVLPRALLALFPGAPAEVKVKAATVDGMIGALNERWPGMRQRLCDETPRIRPHLSIFCNGQRAVLETPLPDGARVYILTAMSGG
jgi:sulfur-carrier protein